MKPLLLAILLMLSITASTQSFNINVAVTNASTHQPIVGAMVFINQSTKGGITDSTGKLLITNVEETYLQLIVIAKGYETLAYLFTKQQINKQIKFELLAQEDTITPTPKKVLKGDEFKKWQTIFLSEFFGNSTNAGDCYIGNISTLKFSVDSASNLIKVTATEPLQVFNESLGYLIICSVQEILVSSINGIVVSEYYTWFKELTTKRNEVTTKWRTQRYNAFDGSLQHFLQSFYKGVTKQQGFIMNKTSRLYEDKNPEAYANARRIKGAILNREIVQLANNSSYYRNFVDMVAKEEFPLDSIRFSDSTHIGIILSTPHTLQVTYQSKNSRYFYNQFNQLQTSESVVSDIKALKNISIQSNGRYFYEDDIVIQGYWHLLRLADMLPYDYQQPQKFL